MRCIKAIAFAVYDLTLTLMLFGLSLVLTAVWAVTGEE